jgi:RNA polymerase sigma-70 factor (ECF subfamily)
MNSDIKDKILFRSLEKKDKDAFVKAYDYYFDDIYRFVYFKVGKKEIAEDLSSSVFLKTWDFILNNSISDYKTLRALFYKIARNVIIDYYRKKSTQMEESIDTFDYLDTKDESQDLESKIDLKMDYRRVMEKIGELKDEYREVLVLRFVNELSVAEIANILEKEKGNVRVIIHRALNALKDLVK